MFCEVVLKLVLVPAMRWGGSGGWCIEKPSGLQVTRLIRKVLGGYKAMPQFYSDNLTS